MKSLPDFLFVSIILPIFAAKIEESFMGKVVNVKEQLITTNSGMKFIRRIKTVEMPNGKYRYPVDYYDASPEPVRITQEERERRRIPIYEPVI